MRATCLYIKYVICIWEDVYSCTWTDGNIQILTVISTLDKSGAMRNAEVGASVECCWNLGHRWIGKIPSI